MKWGRQGERAAGGGGTWCVRLSHFCDEMSETSLTVASNFECY